MGTGGCAHAYTVRMESGGELHLSSKNLPKHLRQLSPAPVLLSPSSHTRFKNWKGWEKGERTRAGAHGSVTCQYREEEKSRLQESLSGVTKATAS